MLFMKMPNKAQLNEAKLSVEPSVKFLSINESKPQVLSELSLALWVW